MGTDRVHAWGSTGTSGPAEERGEDPLGKRVPVTVRHPHLDIGAPLQLVSEWVTMRMHRGDDRRVLGEERPNRIAEPLRGDLTGQESANGDLGLAERGDQPLGEGALADPGAALEKQGVAEAQRS